MRMSCAFIHAFREMRNGLRGFLLFLGCLSLGVAAIAASGTVNGAVQNSIDADSKTLLGGDMQLRLSWRTATEDELNFLKNLGETSHISYLRTMIKAQKSALAEIKAVETNFPLSGEVLISPNKPLHDILKKQNGVFGAVADRSLLIKLGAKIGDVLNVGKAKIRINAEILKEPDRTNAIAVFGSRLLISQNALNETGLIRPGSLYENRYNLLLKNGITFQNASDILKQKFPDTEWKIRGTKDAASGMRRFFNDISAYLALIGLAALIVGGIGIANAVRAWMNNRISTIAVYKCVGASQKHIFAVSFIQILIMAAAGVMIGILSGSACGDFGLRFLNGKVPFAVRAGIYAKPLILAACYGFLITIAFSLLPLSAMLRVSPSMLMKRQNMLPVKAAFSPYCLIAVTVCCVLMACLAVWTTPRKMIAVGFAVGALASFVLFKAAAELVKRGAKVLLKHIRFSSPSVRLGISNLSRRNAATAPVILSVGMGLTALVAVMSAEYNISAQIAEDLPEKAPSFFFTDIQKNQIGEFDAIIASAKGSRLISKALIARGRVTEIKGKPVVISEVPAQAKWAVNSDRALTEAGKMPENVVIDKGKWWQEDYDGSTLVSVESGIAENLDLNLGDTLTVNVMGKYITATIANTRSVNWSSLQMNFAFIFSPSTFDGLPYMWIATVKTDSLKNEDLLQERLAERMPNVVPVRVKEAIAGASEIMQMTGKAVSWASLLGIVIGIMVLGGAMLAGQAGRIRDAVILKVLGAQRTDILSSYAAEFGILGVVSGLIACFLGNAASYAVIVHVMRLNWSFDATTTFVTVICCGLVTLVAGFAGTWQALGTETAAYLRRD